MIDKETYKKELKRMFDSLSGGNKSTDRCGIKCSQCPLKKICNNNMYAFDVIEAVEKWSKENKYKVSKLEYDIMRAAIDYSCEEEAFKDVDILYELLINGYFKGAKPNDKIIDFFKNCEVEEE